MTSISFAFKHSNTDFEMSEATKASRSTSKRLFTRAENALQQALEVTALEETLKRRFDDFRKRWDNVQEVHDNYVEGLGEITDEEIAIQDQWIGELGQRFYNLEMRVDSDLDERKKVELASERTLKQEMEFSIAKEAASAKVCIPESNSNYIQLERIRFTQFDGDIRKYPKSKEEFLTHIRPLCNGSQLPFVLKSYFNTSLLS